MTDNMRARSSDFFVIDEDVTVEINGGFPFVSMLNEGLLEDLRRETLPLTSDVSAAEGLLDLVESELVAYGTAGGNGLDDEQLALAIRAFEAGPAVICASAAVRFLARPARTTGGTPGLKRVEAGLEEAQVARLICHDEPLR